MTVRDGSDNPVTLLQLQKNIWETVKKIPKNELLKEIMDGNVIKTVDHKDYETLQTLVDITLSLYLHKRFIAVNKQEKRTFKEIMGYNC